MYLMVFFVHGGAIFIRLIFSKHPVLTVNSFYIVDVSRSPLYEIVLLSQVRPCNMQICLRTDVFCKNF
jgi:hypothetical protein